MRKISLLLFLGIIVTFLYSVIFMPTINTNYDRGEDLLIFELIPKNIAQPAPAPPPRTGPIPQTEDTKPSSNEFLEELDKPRSSAEISFLEQRVMSESIDSYSYMPLIKLIIKFIFSLMFAGSALYVILSKRYDKETQKWAFSVLSLISGVWIGTVT